MEDVPTFAEAERRFSAFVEARGHAAEVCWVFRDDFYRGMGRSPVVRWPLPDSNRTLSEQRFEAGRRLGRGVQLAALCHHGARTFAYVWFPESDLEAEYSLISGLKLLIPDPLPEGRLEANRWLWAARRLLPAYRSHQRDEELVPPRGR